MILKRLKIMENRYRVGGFKIANINQNLNILKEHGIDPDSVVPDSVWQKLMFNTGVNYKDRLIDKSGFSSGFQPSWNSLLIFVPQLSIINLLDKNSLSKKKELPKRPYNDNEDTVVNEGFTSREKKTVNIPESYLEGDNKRFKEIEKDFNNSNLNVVERLKIIENRYKTFAKLSAPVNKTFLRGLFETVDLAPSSKTNPQLTKIEIDIKNILISTVGEVNGIDGAVKQISKLIK